MYSTSDGLKLETSGANMTMIHYQGKLTRCLNCLEITPIISGYYWGTAHQRLSKQAIWEVMYYTIAFSTTHRARVPRLSEWGSIYFVICNLNDHAW